MAFSPSPLRLRAAVDALLQGGVVACPTEAVWGLSCDPQDEFAIARLLELKNRPQSKGLILVAGSRQQLDYLTHDLMPAQQALLAESWPGAVTFLLPHHDRVSPWVSGEHDTVAVRVSNHPVVRALCAAWGGPLVSTSANPAGARPAREAFQVRRYFGDQVDNLLSGRTGSSGRPSIIRDLISGQIIRD